MRHDSNFMRESLGDWIERLLVLYERHDPRFPNDTFDKTADAYQAIELCWRIMDRAADWAQRHIIGIEYANDRFDELCELEIFHDLYDERGGFGDSHPYLELIALIDPEWSISVPDFEGEFWQRIESVEVSPLDMTARRRYIANMLMSRSVGSFEWRQELIHGLLALNEGSQQTIMRPDAVKGQGNSYMAWEWRRQAVEYICYLYGCGRTKGSAREIVATALAKSVETIRDWEKALRSTTRGKFRLDAAEFAGKYRDGLLRYARYAEEKTAEALILEKLNERFEYEDRIEYAKYCLKKFENFSLSELREYLDRALRDQLE